MDSLFKLEAVVEAPYLDEQKVAIAKKLLIPFLLKVALDILSLDLTQRRKDAKELNLI